MSEDQAKRLPVCVVCGRRLREVFRFVMDTRTGQATKTSTGTYGYRSGGLGNGNFCTQRCGYLWAVEHIGGKPDCIYTFTGHDSHWHKDCYWHGDKGVRVYVGGGASQTRWGGTR